MKEYPRVRQIPGEDRRRWFCSHEFDLIIRQADDGSGYTGFELCYDKTGHERALLWSRHSGYSHMTVDDGEQHKGRYKQTPIMIAGGTPDLPRLYHAFLAESRSLPTDVAEFVLHVLQQYPGFQEKV